MLTEQHQTMLKMLKDVKIKKYVTHEKYIELDRVDTNGNYELSNCRWADWTEQNLNKNFYNEDKFHNIRVRENGKYYVTVARNNHQRKRTTHSLSEAITTRDKWKNEYLENKEKWIKETELNIY